MGRMLAAEDREMKTRPVGIPRDEARDDGVDEKGISAVDEEIELLQLDRSLGRWYVALRELYRPQNPSARTSSRNLATLRSLISS